MITHLSSPHGKYMRYKSHSCRACINKHTHTHKRSELKFQFIKLNTTNEETQKPTKDIKIKIATTSTHTRKKTTLRAQVAVHNNELRNS